MATRQQEKRRRREERLERERQTQLAAGRRRRLAIGGGAALAIVLAGVAVAVALTSGGDGVKSGAGSSGPGAETIADVHGVGVNPADKALYLASHSGLFRSAPGASTATRVEAPEQDLMGFTIAGPDRFMASGHPGAGQDGPSSLGLIESRDRGRTWRPVSLEGSDLHLLRAAGEAVYAFDGELRVSRDGGRSWEERSAPAGLIDLAIDPARGDRVLASTESGVQVS